MTGPGSGPQAGPRGSPRLAAARTVGRGGSRCAESYPGPGFGLGPGLSLVTASVTRLCMSSESGY